jgi:diphthamide biosynthesis methyltransferase
MKSIAPVSPAEQAKAHGMLSRQAVQALGVLRGIEDSGQLLAAIQVLATEARSRFHDYFVATRQVERIVVADADGDPDLDLVPHRDHEVELATIRQLSQRRHKHPLSDESLEELAQKCK